jgi:hypothetical protein
VFLKGFSRVFVGCRAASGSGVWRNRAGGVGGWLQMTEREPEDGSFEGRVMLKSWEKIWIIYCPDWPHRWQASSHKEPCCQCDLRHNTRTCGSWLASDEARSDTLKTSDTPLLDQLSALNDRMQFTSHHRTLWERACSRRGPAQQHHYWTN